MITKSKRRKEEAERLEKLAYEKSEQLMDDVISQEVEFFRNTGRQPDPNGIRLSAEFITKEIIGVLQDKNAVILATEIMALLRNVEDDLSSRVNFAVFMEILGGDEEVKR